MFKKIIISSIILLTFISCQKEKKSFVAIGTGSLTGLYYPTGGAIAKLVNKNTKEHHINVAFQSTGGSVFNINAIVGKELEFGIVQSDRQYQAYKGLKEWRNKPHQELRSVFSIHHEAIHLLAAVDENINTVIDLKGKKVNIGGLGSGSRQNAFDVLQFFGLTENDILSESVQAADAPTLLQDDRLDAFFYTVGQPNGNIQASLAGRRKQHFIPLTMDSAFYVQYPYYAPTQIKAESYPSTLKEPVPTFGVKATLTTRVDVPDDVVYQITKAVFDNFEDFKKLHVAYSHLTKEDMLKGLSAPLHPGAVRYYKEKGLLQ